MKKIGYLLSSFLLITLALSFGDSTAPSNAQDIPSRTPRPPSRSNSIPLYGMFETSFTVSGSYDNPYDPAQVDVTITFTAPSGRSVRVPGFYMQQFQDTCQQRNCLAEILEQRGNGEWRVRFSPTEVGTWQYNISGMVRSNPIVIGSGSFEVVESDLSGFIRVAENRHYFEFDNGLPYFPVGQNLGWSWTNGGGIYTYLDWLDALAESGANYARIYLDVPWFIGLEWASPPGQYNGTGQQAAWRFDTILEAAENRGIYLQVVLIWHQAFREFTGLPVNIPTDPSRPDISPDFDNHPYNIRQGGTMQGAGDIFFNAIAQGWLQQRLRYITARWGYSANIFAWEIVDNFDRMAAFTPDRDNEWLNNLIEVIQSFDPNDHLITVGTRTYQPIIQANPSIDFTQLQFYQARPIEQAKDQVTQTFATVTDILSLVERPVLLTEFSLNPWFEPVADDPSGIHIRDTIWTAALSGTAGGAMTWWWDTYIAPNDLYHIYSPIALFSKDIPWNSLDLAPIEPALVAGAEIDYAPLRLDDFNRQFREPSPSNVVYHITADGSAPPTARMSSYLYGQRFNSDNRQSETFVITPPIDTTLIIGIRNVSTAADARLVVTIDGRDAAALDFSAGTDATTFTIPLTAGRHRVIFDNQGDDWLQLEYLEITDYRAPLRAIGLADNEAGIALVWIHHRENTWEQALTATAITPLQFRLDIPDMPTGLYRIEFWDTMQGNVLGEDRINLSQQGILSIPLLPINNQLAIRVFRIADPE